VLKLTNAIQSVEKSNDYLFDVYKEEKDSECFRVVIA
jgi:hypothetical protein